MSKEKSLPLSMSLEEKSINELEQIKAMLVEKVYKLRNEVKERGKSGSKNLAVRMPDLLRAFLSNPNQEDNQSSRNNNSSKKCCEVSQSILGIQFKDATKNWLHDDIYRFDAHVVTRVLQFSLELTVKIADVDDYEAQDINCHFVNVDKAYMLEITPWVQKFTHEKSFSCLMSAVSDYSEQSVMRAKLLDAKKIKRYMSFEKCHNNGGGIMIYVHKPEMDDHVLLKFQWYLQFASRNWRIEHMFTIDPVEAGEEFVDANKDLLQSFCRVGLTKPDLDESWQKLFKVIDDYKG